MIENILNSVVKDVRQYLYGFVEDERFCYWSGVPDWGSYLPSLKQKDGLGSEVSFGGVWVEGCVPNKKWSLTNINWEYQIKVFLMRPTLSGKNRIKIQQDLLQIFRLFDHHGLTLESEFAFDRGDLSLLLKRAGIGLSCGEVKFSLLAGEQ